MAGYENISSLISFLWVVARVAMALLMVVTVAFVIGRLTLGSIIPLIVTGIA
jgi:hypothetical protein